MSDSEQTSAKVIRTSSGSTRLSAEGGSGQASGAQGTAAPAEAPAAAPASGTSAQAGSAGAAPAPSGSAGSGVQRTAGSSGAATAVAAPVGSGPTESAASADAGRASSPAQGLLGDAPQSGQTIRASSGGVKVGSKSRKGPRTVKLTVAKLDPWSVAKMSFLLSVAIGIATVVAALVLWLVLQATGTLQGIQSTVAEIAGTEGAAQLLGLFSLGRVLSFSIILALINIVLMTALSTLFAFLYNIGSSLVGGFHLTLTDD